MITVTQNINHPRYPSLQGIDAAFEKEITQWNADDVQAKPEEVGILSSPTKVKKTFSPSAKSQGTMLQGSIKEMAAELINKLKEKEIIQEFD